MYNWYRQAQKNSDNVKLIDLHDIIELYELERPYGVYLNKKRMGGQLTDVENLAYLQAMHKLPSVVNKLGQQFNDICLLIAKTSHANPLHDELWCPECFEEMMTIDDRRPPFLYPEGLDRDNFDFDKCSSYYACPSCGFSICITEWESYMEKIEQHLEFGSPFFTDFGMKYVVGYMQMWKKANSISEKIIALQYIINAIHGNGVMIDMFIEDGEDKILIVGVLDKISGTKTEYIWDESDTGIDYSVYDKPRWHFVSEQEVV